MNLRQKNLMKNLVLVVLVTIAMVIGLVNFKDWVNQNEAMRAMHHLGQIVLALLMFIYPRQKKLKNISLRPHKT